MIHALPSPASSIRLSRFFRTTLALGVMAVAILAVLFDDTAHAYGAANAGVLPVAVSGTVLGITDGHLAVLADGANDPVAFVPDPVITVTRDGNVATLAALVAGDRVRLMVDARSGHVLRADAEQIAPAIPAAAALAALLGLIVAGLLLAWRERAALISFDAPVAAQALLQRIGHACAAPVPSLSVRRVMARS